MKILAQVRKIGELQEFEGTTFKKIDLTVNSKETNIPYKLSLQNDNIKLKEGLLLGSDIYVTFRISGNYYDKKDNKGKKTGEKDVMNTLVVTDLKPLN